MRELVPDYRPHRAIVDGGVRVGVVERSLQERGGNLDAIPGQDYTLYFEPDDCLVVLRMPGSTLADELVDRDPAAAPASLGTREIRLVGGRLNALATMQRTLVNATKPKAGSASAPCAEQLEACLCS